MNLFTENFTLNLEIEYKSDFRILKSKKQFIFFVFHFLKKWDRRVCKTENQVTVALLKVKIIIKS